MAARVTEDSDQPVIEAIQQGDHDAFRRMLRRHDRWVRGVIYGVLGDRDRLDDVAQQVWTAVWQRASELRDVRRWRAWLYRLARNAALDAGRDVSRRRGNSAPVDPEHIALAIKQTPASEYDTSEGHRAVLEAIRSLPALYREPFVLRHLEDWSYRQIADALDVPVDTVETRLVRARRMLREALLARGESF